MSLLRVRNLSKSYGGVTALAGVSFAIDAGERLAVIGPNGAGKTTCFNILHGQIRQDSGTIEFSDHQLGREPPRERVRLGMGRSFQVASVFSSLTVRENVQAALLSHHRRLAAWWPIAKRFYRAEADTLIERVGMTAHADRSCAALAYGDLKRVELAMALASRPRLLLMDEPAAGMGMEERAALMALTAELAKRERMAILFTEHDMDVVFAHADRIIVLAGGRVIAEGSPAAIRTDPLVRESYLGTWDHA